MDFIYIDNNNTGINYSETEDDFTIFNETGSGYETSRKNMLGYLQVVLSILAMLTNLFIVCIILSSKALRNSSKHLLILNLCFVDLVKTAAILLYAYMNLEESLMYECDLEYIARLITDLTTGLSGAFIVLLNIDYMATTNNSSCYPGRRFCAPVVLSFLNYIITGAILVPLFVLHLIPDNVTEFSPEVSCWPFTSQASYLVYEALPVLPHVCLIILSGGMTLGGYIFRAYLLNISKELDLVRRPIDLNLAGLITVVLHLLPYGYSLSRKLVLGCELCSVNSAAYFVFPMLPFIKCVLLPFMWLHCPDIRAALNMCSRPKPARETLKDIEQQHSEEHKEEVIV